MQSAVCGLQSAVCGLQSAVCSLQSAVCSLQMSYTGLWVASVHQAFFFLTFSSKVVSEEFFRRILKASPLTNPFITPGG